MIGQASGRHARDRATRAMAQAIIDDETREISEMEAWLKRRGR